MQTVMILGRQPAIGLAELENLYGAKTIRPIGEIAAMVETEAVDFARIGGSLKAAKLLNILDTSDWREIQNYLEYTIPEHLKKLGEGKLRLGISVYGFNITPQKITATGLNLKKVIRLSGRSVRLVPNNETALNSAQVLYNKLTQPRGWELLLIKDGSQTILAQTIAVQDIDAYTLRDRGRPKRDARVGMLPPKLAQIIVNLAVGQVQSPVASRQSLVETQATRDKILKTKDPKLKVLDPFCGTGVILQEAGLIGYGIYGTDIDERMVDYSRQNLHWLTEKADYDGRDSRFEVADATSYSWPHEYDVIATETYLGRAFTTPPPADMLEKNRRDCNTIIRKFLINIHNQTKPGFRLGLALPTWFVGNEIHRLPLLDSLDALGYNRIQFVHAPSEDLVYHRDKQIVGRELVVLIRK